MRKRFALVFLVMILFLTACTTAAPQVIYITQAAPQPQIVYVTATPYTVVQPQAQPQQQPQPQAQPQNPPAQTSGAQPMVSGTEPLDCFPYPSFKALYLNGIPQGLPVPVVGKSESKWGDWWQVNWQNMDGSPVVCWVYGGFTSPSGDFSQIKVVVVAVPRNPDFSYCDGDGFRGKYLPGHQVQILDGRQDYVAGIRDWFPGMNQYIGAITKIMQDSDISPQIDAAGCVTVRLHVDGGEYAWRVRNLKLVNP